LQPISFSTCTTAIRKEEIREAVPNKDKDRHQEESEVLTVSPADQPGKAVWVDSADHRKVKEAGKDLSEEGFPQDQRAAGEPVGARGRQGPVQGLFPNRVVRNKAARSGAGGVPWENSVLRLTYGHRAKNRLPALHQEVVGKNWF